MAIERLIDGGYVDINFVGERLVAGGFLAGAGDSTAPVLSSGTVTQNSNGPTEVDLSVSTDEANGTLYYYFSANSSETAATVKASATGSQAVSTTGAQTVTAVAGWPPGAVHYCHYMHEDAATNQSNVVSASLTTSHYAGSQTLTITVIPSDSILWYYSGTQTAADDASSPDVLTDSAANGGSGWTVNDLAGTIVNNTTDGSSDTIASNTATTATTTTGLAGGVDNSFDQFDSYNITADAATSDIVYFVPAATVSSEQYTFKYYIYDDSAGTYSESATVTVTASGATDGAGTVSLDAEAVPTFTATSGSGGPIFEALTLEEEEELERLRRAQMEDDVLGFGLEQDNTGIDYDLDR